ncbi:hypothetical protein [Couchioplanes azureus]|uniref:hypothetical protein n=1 Tax=Couchioplanes caeruleus TaxID=56438 RepID=UPI0027E58803|nr:hypothetical protein [Couchioplanes caeruleus]
MMARHRRAPTPHTDWCTRDHRCGINEHRSADLIADGIGGRAILTRVRAGDVEYAEIRARIPLHHTETGARWQLATTLRLLREVLAAIAIRPGLRDGRPDRATLTSRKPR